MSRAKTSAEDYIQWLIASPKDATMTESSRCSPQPVAHDSYRRLLLSLEPDSDALWEEVKSRLHQLAHNLSGGQQQRLCIARAIATDPDVVLFDEPTSALDPIATSKIEELIVELKKRVTVIIVTHNLQQAGRISDMTAFMYLGELIEFGETNRVFTNPAKPQTEDYISGRFG